MVFFTSVILLAINVKAAVLEMEWEPVEGAVAFEVMIQAQQDPGKIIRKEVKTPRLKEQIPEGTYSVQLRTIRRDGQRGAWSQAVTVEAKPLEVAALSPKPNEVIEANQADKEVLFSWSPLPPHAKAQLNIANAVGKKLHSQLVSGTFAKVKLKAGQDYSWSLIVKSRGVVYTAFKDQSFSVYGERLPTPDLLGSVQGDKTQVQWKPVIDAESYQVELSARALDEEKFEVLLPAQPVQGLNYSTASLRPKAYRLSVLAVKKGRLPSVAASFDFVIKPSAKELN